MSEEPAAAAIKVEVGSRKLPLTSVAESTASHPLKQ